jgi:hypothetical protein
MNTAPNTDGLKLTEEEAYALLSLAMTSPQLLDANSEKALRKLAEYCANNSNHYINIEASREFISAQSDKRRELTKVGA